MKKNASKRFLAWVLALFMVVTYMPSIAYATDTVQADTDAVAVEEPAAETQEAEPQTTETTETTETAVEANLTEIPLLDGKLLVHNSLGRGSYENGVVTVTAPGHPLSTMDPNVVTVYNKTSKSAVVSFDYSASNYKDFNKTNDNGTFEGIIEAGKGEMFSITGKRASSDNTAVLTLSNFTFTEIKDASQLKFEFDSSLGKVSVAGENIVSGYETTVTYSEGVALVAEPVSGVEFLGWIDADGKLYSREATYTLKPTKDAELEAVFVNDESKGYYLAGGGKNQYLFDDFSAAAAKASTLSEQVMVLMNDTTLAAGTYTVPAGVTLLIPFDDANTLYTNKPGAVHGEYATPTAYRTLTMADGASLVINGALSLSAKMNAANGSNRASGSPTGDVSYIDMEEGSSITVNDGASLYAYGYIVGEGAVTAKSGSTVFENFQVEDFRGGAVTTEMVEAEYEKDKKYGILPLSQYYVQNIEVPLTLEKGATEKAFACVYMSSTIFALPVDFISSNNAMFNLTKGSVVKKYDGVSDRLIVEANGNMSLSPITVTVGESGDPNAQSLDSSSFKLPINSNITVDIKSGEINIDQDLSLLPGSEILIEEGARCTLNDDAVVYVYDADQWGKYCVSDYQFIPVSYAPGRDGIDSKTANKVRTTLTDAKVLVNGTLDASKGLIYATTDESGETGFGNVYSTKNGTVKVISGYDEFTYQYQQNANKYDAINIKPLNLINGDGSYVQTLDLDAAGTYTYKNGNWVCDHAVHEEKIVDPTCTEAGSRTVTCEMAVWDCGHTYTEVIPATGHDEKKVAAKAATCTAAGNEVYWECETCHKIYKDSDLTEEFDPVIPALGHDEVTHAAQNPTCGVVGWKEYVTCSRCDYSTYQENELAALEHDPVHFDAVAKTCTTDGNKEYWACLNCLGKFEDESCTKAIDPVIPAGHDWDNPDCESPKTCKACGAEEGAALGHDWADPTCTAPKTCKVCGKTDENVPALDHDWNDATCIDPKTCKVCGETEGEALGHDEETHNAKPANCTEVGWDAYVTCSRCDYSTYVEIPALGHDTEKVEATGATCTAAGHIKHWTCKNAGCDLLFADNLGDEVLSEEDVIIPIKDHTVVVDPAVDADCENAGKTEGSHCDVCGTIIDAQIEIPKLGHDWDEGKITSKPTIDKEGIKVFTCKNEGCGKTYTEKLDKLTENQITTYEDFIENLAVLEDIAKDFVKENPGKDPLKLIIKYIRTGVDRYNSGSWNIMGGYEDPEFAAYVTNREYEYNLLAEEEGTEKMVVTGMKNIENFTLPNGDLVDLGHVFGTMDLTYTNPENAEVGGWAGDLVDLLSLTDFAGTGTATTVNDMADYVRINYLGKERSELAEEGFLPNAEEDEKDNEDPDHYNEGVFGYMDIIGDMDAYYIMKQIQGMDYESGNLTELLQGYFTESLTDKQRAAYLIQHRLNGQTLRTDLREEVYKVYTSNSPVVTLEGTRNWKHDDISNMREAVCYAFADYICKLAGDYFEELENEYFKVEESQKMTLAPGITQTKVKAVTKDNLNLAYYIATVDVTRDDVTVCANYSTRPVEKNTDGTYKWNMMRVIDQANNVQNKYGNPESDDYIPNYNVVAATNGDGYNMYTGEPGGLLLMDGIEYHPCDGSGFFGILADGSAMIGTQTEYEKLKAEGKIKEAIGGFGATLVKDGKIAVTVNSSYFNDRAPRTAVGITKTGKVVMMVMDGRQEGSTLDSSCGGSAIEIAQVMLDAGCEEAINLDGGGSSTYVSKEEGSSELAVVSKPSDGTSRSVSTSLYAVSTAPSSTEFDHAVIESEYAYMTTGTTIQMTATGVSATNNPVDLPEGTEWAVSDEEKATITEDGQLTAKFNGTVDVMLMLDGKVIGKKTINIVVPDNLYFTKKAMNLIYEETVEMPIKAVYNNKLVAINEDDINFELSDAKAGTFDGFNFTAAESDLKVVKITAKLPSSLTAKAELTVYLYTQDEASFDFENAVGGDEQLAWKREVSNSASKDNKTYTAIDRDKDMVAEYTFAIDMSKIQIPGRLGELVYMLPGADNPDATAWTFLCDLAERISEWTEVSAKIVFDDDVEFDPASIKDITLVNDYFALNKEKTVFNEEENSLTITLNWIKQSKSIDVDMANPLCILGGIKLTPKDGVEWPNDALNIVNTGEIRYDVYMRANALYSFSSKPENQEYYGLYPYTQDRDGKTDSGGHFTNVYNTFEDSYTLDKSVRNGWAMGDGGFRYYENDEVLKGIHKIDGYYYKFDEETGINEGKKKYTGEYKDANGDEYYIKNGEINTGTDGWVMMSDGEFRYYNPANGGKKEAVTKDEVKSTCIIDGYCDYTSASGATYHQPYDDAGGHDYKEIDGKMICENCGWQQFKMEDCNVKLSRTNWTYTSMEINPLATATNPKTGEALKRLNPYRDYYVNYFNNIEVGVGKAVVTASKYGKYQDLRQWRGNYSDSVELYYTIRPAEPMNVKYSINNKYVATITWTESESADDYLVQYSTDGGKKWKKAKIVTGNSCTLTLNKKQSFMFRVASRAAGLNAEGIEKMYGSAIYPVAQLKTVSNLRVGKIASTGKPQVAWSTVRGADKYKVYRSTSGEVGTFYRVITTSKNYYTDTKAVAGNKYYYKVRAVYSKNEEANSVLSGVITKTCNLARPALTLSNSTKGQIKISWKKVSGASSYKVYRKVSGGSWKLVGTTTNTSLTNKNLSKGKTYSYRAFAVKKGNSAANSGYSLIKSIKCR